MLLKKNGGFGSAWILPQKRAIEIFKLDLAASAARARCYDLALMHLKPTIASVTLNVASLPDSVEFYQSRLGFKLHGDKGDTARLGAGGDDLLILEEHPNAPRPGRSTGLYHFAILLPSRAALARQLHHLIQTRAPLQGMSDHLVSEAIYLADPEGNGIELYRDRPQSQWKYANGQVQMSTNPLDVEGLLGELGSDQQSWTGLPGGTTLGHIHLRVGDVPAAEAFYRQVLGFDLTTRFGSSASFLSRNGYHHHVAVNNWASQGASPPAPGVRGLKHFTVRARDAADLKRLHAIAGGSQLRDPSGNLVVVKDSNES